MFAFFFDNLRHTWFHRLIERKFMKLAQKKWNYTFKFYGSKNESIIMVDNTSGEILSFYEKPNFLIEAIIILLPVLAYIFFHSVGFLDRASTNCISAIEFDRQTISYVVICTAFLFAVFSCIQSFHYYFLKKIAQQPVEKQQSYGIKQSIIIMIISGLLFLSLTWNHHKISEQRKIERSQLFCKQPNNK